MCIRDRTAFASGIHALLMVVTFGRKAGDIHAAGNNVNRRIHTVLAQKVERLFRRGDDAVNPIAPPLGILARNPCLLYTSQPHAFFLAGRSREHQRFKPFCMQCRFQQIEH